MRALAGILPILFLALPVTAAPPAAEQSAAPAQSQQMSQEERLRLLERRVQVLNDVLMRLDRLQQEVQQLRGDVEQQNHTLGRIKKQQRNLYADIDQRLRQIVAPRPSTTAPGDAVQPGMQSPGVAPALVGPEGVPVTPVPGGVEPTAGTPVVVSPPSGTPGAPIAPFSQPPTQEPPPADPGLEQGVYQRAFDLVMQRRYPEAEQSFEQFLAQYPSGRLAANAQYWLAEVSYVTRNFSKSLDEFSKVIQLYPTSAKVADSKLKMGFILYELREWVQARETLEKVVQDYPASTVARLAQQRLDRMRREGR